MSIPTDEPFRSGSTTSRNGNEDFSVVTFDPDVTGQFSKPGDRRTEKPDQTDPSDQYTNDDEDPPGVLHGSLFHSTAFNSFIGT